MKFPDPPRKILNKLYKLQTELDLHSSGDQEILVWSATWHGISSPWKSLSAESRVGAAGYNAIMI